MPQLALQSRSKAEVEGVGAAVWRDGAWLATPAFLSLVGAPRMPAVAPADLPEALESLSRGRRVTVRVEPLPDGSWVATATVRPSVDIQSRLLSITSHDLRGPMANARAYAAFLLDGRTELDPKLRRSLEIILRNSDRVLSLLRDYFDSAQAQLGRLELDAERQAVLPLLESALAKARPLAEEKSLGLRFDHADPLPDVPLDAAAFEHAATAFLENGIARSDHGSQVRMVARADAGGVRVEVIDRGPPVLDPDAAFDRERRTLAEGKLSYGFRLALARDEIELLHGHVGVEGRNEGTAFFFTLPLETPR